MKRFTAYRRNISQRASHNSFQKNPDDAPQFEGVEWSDGTVTLRWLTACRSHSTWDSLADMLVIHGHPEYGTEIDWHDWHTTPQIWLDMVRVARRPTPTHHIRVRTIDSVSTHVEDDGAIVMSVLRSEDA